MSHRILSLTMIFMGCAFLPGCDKSTSPQPTKSAKIIPKIANTVLVTEDGSMKSTQSAGHYQNKIQIDFKTDGKNVLNLSGERDAYVCKAMSFEFKGHGAEIKRKKFLVELELVENKGDADIWRVTEVIGDIPLSQGDEFDYQGGERLLCDYHGTKIYLTNKLRNN